MSFEQPPGGAKDAGNDLAVPFMKLDVQVAARLLNREHHRRFARADEKGSDGAFIDAGGGNPHGPGRRQRRVTLMRHEIAHVDVASRLWPGNEHGLRGYLAPHVAKAHSFSGSDAQPLQPVKQRLISIELNRRLEADCANRASLDQHHRHSAIDACDSHTVDRIDRLAGGKKLTGTRAGCVHEGQRDRRCAARYTVDRRFAEIGDVAIRRGNVGFDHLAGIDVVDSDERRFPSGWNETRLDGERADRSKHVAAVR